MPTAALDTDLKYHQMLKLCLEMHKKKNAQIKCQIFENVLEGLNWATESKDQILMNQVTSRQSAYSSYGNEEVSTKPLVDQQNGQKTNVLITGSLYLVGLALKVLNYKIL